MTNTSFSWELYYKAPIVGIVRSLPSETVKKIAEAYLEAGLHTIEITMNTEGAAEIIRDLRTSFPNLNVGAGTVCNMGDLTKALDAGSQFIVTPIIDEEVIKTCVAKNVPVFPGAYTPSEIYKAWTLGASAVKIFPATQLGPQYIKDVLAPLNTIKLLPTGGVSKENIKAFFDAGAVGVGMGSSLLNKKCIQEEDFDGLKKYFISIKNEIQSFLK
ncbi:MULTISPECIES: bifunctional 4-hydroxy-2-oxoglutarate aldolase/2-dehydro-3-deoxy-phosphogluconate aldolase [unclassified Lacinutrix]